MQEILFNQSAVKIVLETIKAINPNIQYINHGRYAIVRCKDENIAIMFKRRWFEKFGMIFKHKGASGIGDSLNAEDMRSMALNHVKKIYTLYKDGKIYEIPLYTILTKGFEYENKEGKRTYSFSIHEYKRVNKEAIENDTSN